MSDIKNQLQEDIKSALKTGNKEVLSVLRLFSAAIKQFEVDKRATPTNEEVVQIFDKLAKQRRDSIQQFTSANRDDLVKKEQYELNLLQNYLPKPLSDAELVALISETIQKVNATSVKDLGTVMAKLKPLVIGKADFSVVSKLVKDRLS